MLEFLNAVQVSLVNPDKHGKKNVYDFVADTFSYILERPLYFDPFGQIEFAHFGHNMIDPCKVLVQGSILFYPFRYSGFS